MDESNRINRRSRPRPYDLRRKVLLKNFLKEQMTHIPETRIDSFSHISSTVSAAESLVSDPIGDFTNLNENESSVTNCADSCTSSSDYDEENNIDLNQSVIESNELNVQVETEDSSEPTVRSTSCSDREPSLFKLTNLLSLKKDSKKSSKGIFKAKAVCKRVKRTVRTRYFQNQFQKIIYGRKHSDEKVPPRKAEKNSPKTLFSLFKHRKELRHAKEHDRFNQSPEKCNSSSTSKRCNTSNQSVQTDSSWVRAEMIKVQQSNKRLKEENRLLSESLSYFMSNASSDPQVRHFSSPHESPHKDENSLIFHDYCVSPSNSNNNSMNYRSRVSRSKSVHEYSNRRSSKNNYCTRSASFHTSQNYASAPVKPHRSAYSEAINVPRVRRNNTITNIPMNSSGRRVQRRSSMPERTVLENDRYYNRSGNVRDTYTRTPFYALPSEAFY